MPIVLYFLHCMLLVMVAGADMGLMWQGRVIKGEAGIRRSRYVEDELINNHTSVRPQT